MDHDTLPEYEVGKATPATPPDHASQLSAMLMETNHLLRQLSEQLQDNVHEVAVGAADQNQVLENWPVAGRKRTVVSQRSSGTDNLVIPAAIATDLLPGTPGRIGGLVTNPGANPATLYLCIAGKQGPGRAAIYLPAGGSWDFRLGLVGWAGPVSVLSTLGTTLMLAVT